MTPNIISTFLKFLSLNFPRFHTAPFFFSITHLRNAMLSTDRALGAVGEEFYLFHYLDNTGASHMLTCTLVFICTKCLYTHTHTHVYTSIHVCTMYYPHTHTHAHLHVCTHIYIYIYVCLCTHMHVCIHM